MEIYTAQFKSNHPDRMDITAFSDDPIGKFFSPPWELVREYKLGHMSEEGYLVKYSALLNLRNAFDHHLVEALMKKDKVVFVCYCPPGKFCHRVLAAKWVEENTKGAVYKGEIFGTKDNQKVHPRQKLDI